MEMHAFGRLTPMEVARRRLLAAVRPLERVDEVPVGEAFGRVVARTVRSAQPVPAFYRATWDGYAVRSVDTRSATPAHPTALRLVGEVFAEQSFAHRLRPGETVAIATGGALPSGSDGVVIFEDVRRRGTEVRLRGPVRPGDRLAAPGDDFRRGQVLAKAGEVLTPSALAMIAACGVATVAVRAQPVVAIIPNGNELLVPGTRPKPGRIFESNNASLSAVIQAAGGVPHPFPPVPDEARRIEATLRRALRTSDLVLATGGSSVGERDHLPRIFARMGKVLFHGIAVRPGKPTLAARVNRDLIVGMPGHPSSCLTNAFWLLLPALRRLGGRPGPGWSEAEAVLERGELRSVPGLSTVVPLRAGSFGVHSVYHGSSSISSLSGAVGFTVLPPGRRVVRAGERLPVRWLLPPLGPGAGPPRPRNG